MIAVSALTRRTLLHGSKHIEEQTILRDAGKPKRRCRLRTMIRKLSGILYPIDMVWPARRSPTKVPYRSLRITDPQKFIHARRGHTAKDIAVCVHQRGGLGYCAGSCTDSDNYH